MNRRRGDHLGKTGIAILDCAISGDDCRSEIQAIQEQPENIDLDLEVLRSLSAYASAAGFCTLRSAALCLPCHRFGPRGCQERFLAHPSKGKKSVIYLRAMPYGLYRLA